VEVVPAPLVVERPGGAAAEDRLPVVRDLVGPDVEVGPFPKPGMPVRGVVGDEVEQDADPAGACFRDEAIEILERAEVGMDPGVVRDVVAPVDVRRGVHGLSQTASTPSHSRYSSRSVTPTRSPIPSPFASANERG
jgi:hypothetical protein